MKNPLISIIVPVYNVEKYLPTCLQSLIHQTYQNIEIICINNGSTDKSNNILKKFQKNDNRIKLIDTINEGVSIARNKGLEFVEGDYIMFVDSDDWIDIDTCEQSINLIVENDSDIVMWSYIREYQNKSLPKMIFNKDKMFFEGNEVKKLYRRFIGLVGEELSRVENADALCPVWGKLYKTSIIKDNDIQFFDIRKIGTYEDGLFNLNVFRYINKAIYINEYYYHYRKNNKNSITFGYNNKLYSNWQNLYDLMEKYIRDNFLSNEYKLALQNRVSLGIIGLGLNVLSADLTQKNKIKEIKRIISTDRYRNSIKYLNLNYFPIHWKVFFLCAKYNLTVGLYILLLCIKKGIDK